MSELFIRFGFFVLGWLFCFVIICVYFYTYCDIMSRPHKGENRNWFQRLLDKI